MYSCLFQANNPMSFEGIFKDNKVDYSCFNKTDDYGIIFEIDRDNIEKQMETLIKLRQKTDRAKSLEEFKESRWRIARYLDRLNSLESYQEFLNSFDYVSYGMNEYFKSELFKKDFTTVLTKEFNTILANVNIPENVTVDIQVQAKQYDKWYLTSSIVLYDTITSIKKELPFLHADLEQLTVSLSYETAYPAQVIRREIKQYLQDIA